MRTFNRQLILLITICIVILGGVFGCAVTENKPQLLTYYELVNNVLEFKKPFHNGSFIPSSNSDSAHHDFSGNIALSSIEMKIRPKIKSQKDIIRDPKIFPGVTLSFFSHQGDLVPVTRGVITPKPEQANNSYWEIIVQPGKTWSEPEDIGWSRASFPFALMNSQENETHNGIGMFLFNEREVSAVYFQIVIQTTPWLIREHFIAWGRIPAKYDRTPIVNLKALKKSYEIEKKNKLPIAEWSVLEQKVDKGNLSGFEGNMREFQKVISAIVFDDVIYYKPCKTKFGDYPYTQNMRFGIWSVTKSVGPGLGMLRLAQKYGTRVFDLKIKDYVDITANHNGWEDVTFGDALNMATGIGDKTGKGIGMLADYGSISPYYRDFALRAFSAEEKLSFISKSGNYPWGPGEFVRYRDRDMFILGAAMNKFLKLMEGPNMDIWEMIAEEVFKPIHIYHAPMNRTIEPDGNLGLPLMAWGWYPSLDDLAKVAGLLHRRGNFNGQQLLHFEKTNDLFSTKGSLGGKINWDYGERRYKCAFHYLPFPDQSGELMYLPYMEGWLGNLVLLMPNNITGIKISKAYPYTSNTDPTNPTPMAKVGNRLKPFYQWAQ